MHLRELIERHIASSGTGYEIDDIISSGNFSAEIITRIVDIEQRYRSKTFKVGISNPASYVELRQLADQYPD